MFSSASHDLEKRVPSLFGVLFLVIDLLKFCCRFHGLLSKAVAEKVTNTLSALKHHGDTAIL